MGWILAVLASIFYLLVFSGGVAFQSSAFSEMTWYGNDNFWEGFSRYIASFFFIFIHGGMIARFKYKSAEFKAILIGSICSAILTSIAVFYSKEVIDWGEYKVFDHLHLMPVLSIFSFITFGIIETFIPELISSGILPIDPGSLTLSSRVLLTFEKLVVCFTIGFAIRNFIRNFIRNETKNNEQNIEGDEAMGQK